ncbi:MAG TPA: DNA-binding response regulator [Porphyromonadaceae bacterium]|nr:DNA-binding response regulator [Porphyromonadaceae bacterium]
MSERCRVLICESHRKDGLLIVNFLQAKGFEVRLEENGKDGWEAFTSKPYDFCLLGVDLEEINGIELAEKIREKDGSIPIFFLSSKGEEEEILAGFNAGGDDYIVKPFFAEVLYAKMQAVLRRAKGKTETKASVYSLGRFILDTRKQILSLDGKVSKLTAREFALLLLFVSSEEMVLDRSMALKKIWGEDNISNTRTMDVYIAKLRKILQQDPSIELISIHGRGYQIVVNS